MKTETHEQCTVCFEILDTIDPTTITADTLDQLQLLITKLNIKLLRNSPICDTCLAKVKSACKFKTSYLDLQETFHDIKLEDAYSEKPAVCEICKNIISSSDTIPLFDPGTKTNKLMLINHLSSELESKVKDDPQTCESCHKSMLNFCNITNLLSVFDQDICDDSEMPSTTVKNERQDVDSLVSASSSKDFCTRLKKEESTSDEDEETEDKDCNEYEEFLTKNEEVDLKMDCDEEEGDERTTKDMKEETKERSDCKIVWNETDARDVVLEPLTNKEHTSAKSHIEFQIKLGNSLQKHSDEKSLFEEKFDNVKMFQCEVCEYKTNRKRNLNSHMLRHKKPEEVDMFLCEICEYTTKYKSSLKQHILIHKNPDEIEMFQCEICEFKTKHKSSIIMHMKIHKKPEEIKMFQCAICQYKTRKKYNLKAHMLYHKKPEDLEMFQCEVCEYKAKRKTSLKSHMLRHKTPEELDMFKCEICVFKTKHKSSIKTHMLIHNTPDTVEMFQCVICQYKTNRKSHLTTHMRRHKKPEELKMFQCQLCKYKTKRKKDLTRHVRAHKKKLDKTTFEISK